MATPVAAFYIGTLFVLIMIAALRGAVPWLGQKIALYGLHELRDRVYEIGRTNEWARDTLTYRDVDFLLSIYIHVVRDQAFQDCAPFLQRPSPKRNLQSWRAERLAYEDHCIYSENRRVVRWELLAIHAAARRFLWTRMLLGHPAMLALVSMLSLVAFPVMLIWNRESAPDSVVIPKPAQSLTRRDAAKVVVGTMIPRLATEFTVPNQSGL
jgi:hypothetical protein